MAEDTENRSHFHAAEVAALRETGYEIQTALVDKHAIDSRVLVKGVEDGKIKAIHLGKNVRMLRVADVETFVKAYKAERDRREAERSAPRLPTVDTAALEAELATLREKLAQLATGLGTMSGEIRRLSVMFEEVATRPTVVESAPPPPVKVTATVSADDIVGALQSTRGRAALVGSVSAAIASAPVTQAMREALMSALGSKEGRTAIRAAVHEALNGYDATQPHVRRAGGG